MTGKRVKQIRIRLKECNYAVSIICCFLKRTRPQIVLKDLEINLPKNVLL